MLFNSYSFLFVFLPIAVLGYVIAARTDKWWAAPLWLAVCSFYFYADWNPYGVFLLGGSVLVNYLLSGRIEPGAGTGRFWLTFGVLFNLGLLGFFKYADFFIENVNMVSGGSLPLLYIILPIGISFFTFQQIAYLVDVYRGEVADRNFLRYALFVSFFPQLIAGPIVHHGEMMPQFSARNRRILTNLLIGTSIFAIGLFKKVILADSMALQASPVFTLVEAGNSPGFAEAWLAALAYSLQIYFDFSGYSDMAIGLGRMFGITLPVNFAAPYRARSIIEFWRRWHITLSRFLRDYLYVPLGGNRHGPGRRWVNLMVTMGLGGLWHGASWNFALWGLMHGLFLVVNHAWRRWMRWLPLPVPLAIGVTFVAVVFAWVPFRAASLEATWLIWQAMLGLGSGGFIQETIFQADYNNAYPQIAGLLLVCWFWPTTQSILIDIKPGLQSPGYEPVKPPFWQGLKWRANVYHAVVAGLFLMLSVMSLGNVSEFIYFRF